jgi:hypothetical protein
VTVTSLSRLLTLLLAAALAAGCLDPLDDDDAGDAAPEAPLGSEAMNPAGQLLAEEVDRLVDLLAGTRDVLREAAESGDPGTLRAAAERTEEVLIGDPADGHALFPVETLDRGSVSDRDDLMTRTLTAAREAGGDDGRAVTESVRDLIAGDLGGWQRDAEGMVAWAEEVAVERSSMDEIEQAVLELPGGGTQALAYVLLIQRTSSAERAQGYAERAAAHLEVARSLLADLDIETDAPPPAEAEAGADEGAMRP